jgi:hypothetical protein
MRMVTIVAVWGAAVLVFGSGCATTHKQRLHLAPNVVINFKNVHDGKCKVRDIELDAKTGTQTVICKDEDK